MEMSADEKKLAMQAFSRGMLPGGVVIFVGVALNVLFAKASILIPIVSLAMIAVGLALAVVLGLKRRKEVIATFSKKVT